MTNQLTIDRGEFQALVHKHALAPTKVGRGKKATYPDVEVLSESWDHSRMSGSGFGDDYGSLSEPDEKEPNLDQLDNLILELWPDIKLQEYREILDLVDYSYNENCGYYGDSSMEATKSIKVEDLWHKLIGMDFISPVD